MVAGDGRGGSGEVWNCGHTSISAWSFGPHWRSPLFSPSSVALSTVEGTLESRRYLERGHNPRWGSRFLLIVGCGVIHGAAFLLCHAN